MKLTIGHLYPELLNLYGDRGNIQCMMKRSLWRGIEAETITFGLEDSIDFSKLDIVLLGGGSDREQRIVCSRLRDIREDFRNYVEDGGSVLAVCGGYQLLGHYYKTEEDTLEGLSLVDLYTEQAPPVSLTILFWKTPISPFLLLDLKTMEVAPTLAAINLLEKWCMDMATMERMDRRVYYTKM